jgi:SAM-dependent methyltransferase
MTSARPETIEAGSPDRFGYEWRVYSDIRPEYEEQFQRWTMLITREEWKDSVFLDVGCGVGRNSYWPLTYGARAGIAIDVDESTLSSARKNLSAFGNAVVREMSAYEIDYRDYFDIVFSIGVVHHLEFPQAALHEMVKATKPGGKVLIWVYGLEHNRWLLWMLDPTRKLVFSRLPISVTHHLSLYPTLLLWLGLRLRIGWIEYFRLLRQLTFGHLRSIVFDQMLPKIANYWPRETVEDLLRTAGLIDIRVEAVNDMSWCAVGIRPVVTELRDTWASD